MTDGRVLVLAVVVGGMLTFQSSNNLDAVKVAYLAIAGVALAIAFINVRWWLVRERIAISGLWLVSSAAFAILIAVSLLVSRANGTPISDWLRDAAAYGLFAAAPVLGLACARDASRRWILAVIVLCGIFASLSFTVEWLGRRGLLDFPIDRIILPSGAPASALMALATGLAIAGVWRRWWWAVGAGVVLGLFFVTGTRSTLLLLSVPIGAGLIAGRPWGNALRTLLVEGVVALAVFMIVGFGVSVANGTIALPGRSNTPVSAGTTALPGRSNTPVSTTSPPQRTIGDRVTEVATLFTNPGGDGSLRERWAQTQAAWHAFTTSPLVGVGPGHRFLWTDSSGKLRNEYTMDTPLIFIAKFGLLGLIPFALFVAAYLRMALGLWRGRSRLQAEMLAVAGFGIVLAYGSALASRMEDKGVGLILILLLGLGLRALLRDAYKAPTASPAEPSPQA